MHEKSPLLSAQKRERLGTRYAKRDRTAGRLPAVLYGHGQEPLAITLESRQALGMITKGEKVFRLDLSGKGGDGDQMVLLKDVQYDYLGTNIVHCDFARVDLNERVRTRVHVSLIGDAKGLKTAGNILTHPTNEIEIECRVVDIPDHVEVNITDLDLGQIVTAAQVKLPSPDMKLLTDPHAVVAAIALAGTTKTAEEETVAAAGAAEPEVITAKKDDAAKAGDAKAGAAKPAAGKADAKAPAAKPAAGGDAKKK